MLNKKTFAAALPVILFLGSAFAHEAHHKAPHESENKKADASVIEKQIFEQINFSFQKEIKSVFQAKCMNCHSSQTSYPFYYSWPIAKQIINNDIAESKKHLDITNGFPFAGHGTPTEDLNAIKKVVTDGTMPPFRYKIMHWGSALTVEEKQIILNWTDKSISLLDN